MYLNNVSPVLEECFHQLYLREADDIMHVDVTFAKLPKFKKTAPAKTSMKVRKRRTDRKKEPGRWA